MTAKLGVLGVGKVVARVAAVAVLTVGPMLLSGCGSFFQCEGKADCPTTGSGGSGTSGDYAYVSNSSAGSTYLNGYSLTSGTLATTTSSPYSLGYVPSAIAITPANSYVYMTTDSAVSAGYIYGYSIGTGGALTTLDSGTALVSESASAMAVSPDGNWLFVLDTDGLTLEEYSIPSDGILKYANTYDITGAANGVVTPSSVTVAPSGDYVVVALGTGGAETFSFNTTTGVAASATLISPGNASTGIYGVAVDPNNYLYCAGTAGLQVFSVTSAGIATLSNTYTAGDGPHSVVVNKAGTYVYVGNQTGGTISGYLIGTNAALTAIAGSPFTGPTDVSGLAIDNSAKYLAAIGYNASSGTQLFSIGTGGALTLAVSGASGTTTAVPAVLATTH